MLDIRELTVGFGVDGPVFAEAALEVGHGQRLLVCGAAGSGKSTLLNVAAGIIPRLVSAPVFSGTVRFLGMPMDTFERGRLFTAIGSLGQNVEEQLWDLQVEDLIAFPMENRGVARAAIRDRLHALLVDMELTDLRGRRVLTLSGGERRTAAIAAALAMPPQMLVLDEPTTGLDPAARVRQLMQIGRLAGEVPALVIAEQDPSAFEGLVDCVALLSGGKLSAPAPAAELMRAQAPCGGRAPSFPLPRSARNSGAPMAPRARGHDLRASRWRGGRACRPERRRQDDALPVGARAVPHCPRLDRNWWRARRRLDTGPPARSIAYLPQDMRRVLFNMTVIEEVTFAITARTGAADGSTLAQAKEVLGRYGLGGLAEANPFALSARQQALLGLACADAASVLVSILDEPMLARDLHGRRMLDLFLDRMLGDGRSVMMISHDLELIDDVTTRTLILEDGRIAFDGPTSEAWTSAVFWMLDWTPPYRTGQEKVA